MKTLMLVLATALMISTYAATEVYVSPTGDDNTGDGSRAKPYQTIVKGVDSCDAGGTLTLLKGRHDLGYGATEIKKGIVVRGETDNPWDTVVNLNNGAGPAFALNHADMLVCNLAVTNAGGSYAQGSAFKIVGSGGTVSNCVIWKCHSSGWNVGSATFGNSSKALYTHCVLSNCVMSSTNGKGTGGMILGNGSKATKCLIADCSADSVDDDWGAGGVRCDNGYLTDCTIVGCSGKRTGGLTLKAGSAVNCIIVGNTSLTAGATYNDVHPADVARVTNSASAPDAALDDTCVLDLPVNFFRNFLTHDYRPAAKAPVPYGYYPIDAEPKVTMKVGAIKGLAPLTVPFKADVEGFAEDDVVTYSWDFGGGESSATDAAETSATFGIGTYDIAVTVVNETTGKTYRDVKAGVLTVGPKDVYVKYGNATPQSPYTDESSAAAKLADALAAAAEGTTIHLLAGTYGAGGTIDKPVILVGDNAAPENVIISKPISISAAGVSLSGVTFSGATYAIGVSGRNVCISNCVVRNCVNSGPSSTAPVCFVGEGGLVTHCVITNNSNGPSYMDYSDWRGAGGLYINNGVVADSLIAGNKMTAAYGDTSNDRNRQAGGVALGGGARMVNCTVVNNYSNAKKTPVGGVKAGSGEIVNSLISRNAVGEYGDTSCANVMPSDASLFVSCVITDEVTVFEDYAKGMYGPSSDASVFDAGRARADAPAKDLAGADRIQGSAIDIGCYERDPSKFTASVACEQPEGLSPATFSLVAMCVVPEGDDVTYTWYCQNGSDVISYSVHNDTVFEPELTKCGLWDVTLYITNETANVQTMVSNPGFLSVCPKTVRVKLGNADARYPYDEDATAAASIAEALTAAGNGSTVHLSAGTYAESVTFDKTVTVVGDDACPENVIVTKAWSCPVPDVTLSGLTFSGISHMIISGARLTMTNCVVRNAHVGSGYGYSPLRIEGAGALLTHCAFTNNLCEGNYYADYQSGGALYLSGGTVRESLFWKNQATGTGSKRQPGAVTLCDGAQMINCTVADNSGTGLGGVKFLGGSTAVNTIIAGNKVTVASSENANIEPGDVESLSSSVVTTDTSVFEGFFEGLLSPSASPLVFDAGAERADAPAKDLAGADRIRGEAIDLGCYEREPNKFTVSFAVDAAAGIVPATFALQADCDVPEGNEADYVWYVRKGNDIRRVEKTNDKTCSVTLDGFGVWDVSLYVTNRTAGVSASSTTTSFLTTGPKTLYVKAGNESAEAPYVLPETAAATLPDAYAAALVDGQEIVVLPGVYSNGVTLARGIALKGQTGNPEDVVVRGVGIKLSYASSSVCNMAFEDQRFDSYGAGVTIDMKGGTVSNCVFRNMTGTSDYAMAPVWAEGENALVTHCVITNNILSAKLAGASCSCGAHIASDARLENSLIALNGEAAGSPQAAPALSLGAGSVVGCTIASNVASEAAGVFCPPNIGSGIRTVRNTVIAGNVVPAGKSGYKTFNPIYASAFASTAVDESMIGVKHLIVGSTDEFFETKLGTPFMPLRNGKLYNAGDNAAATGAVDLFGNKRIAARNIDIGCFETPFVNGLILLVR